MTYEVYRYIFYGGAILAAIMLTISVILFFVLKIPAVIGYFTGATQRKGIADIQSKTENNEHRGNTEVNINRGKLTDRISPTGSLRERMTGRLGHAMKTEKISTQHLKNEQPANETTVLNNQNETTVLLSQIGETTVLDSASNMNETTILTPDMLSIPTIVIEYEITFVHTDEVIVEEFERI